MTQTAMQLVQAAQAIEPEDEPIREKRLRFETFPVHVLPKSLQDYCTEAGASLGADPSWVAVPMLSALSAAIGNSYWIRLKGSRSQPAALWTVLVGSSGCGKSPALKAALAPIQELQKGPLLAYQNELKQWEAGDKQTAPPRTPTRYTTDDATIEALVGLLQKNPRGLLLARDELAGLFDFGRYSNGGEGGASVAKFLEIWNGGQVLVDRKGGGLQFVDRASLAMTGGIQPKTLARALKPSLRENGFASRMLLARPPEREPDWYDDEVSAESYAAYSAILTRLYCIPCGTDDDGAPTPELLVVDPASPAKDALAKFVREHGQEKAELEEDLGAAWQKLEDYAGRFALVLQLAKWAASDDDTDPPKVADLESIEGGIVLARWFANEAKRLYRELNGSKADKLRDRLLEFIEKRGMVTTRDLERLGPSELRRDKAAMEEWLGTLCNEGAILKLDPLKGAKLPRFKTAP